MVASHLSFHNMKKLFQYHGNTLVPQQVGHHVEVQWTHKVLVEASDAGDGITKLFGAVE